MLKRRNNGGGAPTWMAIYSDMVTLLLAFFVLLYSFSAIDVAKFEMFIQSFQGTGIMDGGQIVIPGPGNENPGETEDDPQQGADDDAIEDDETEDQDDEDRPFWADPDRLYQHVKAFLVDNSLDGEVSLAREERGVNLELSDHLLYSPGSAVVTTNGQRILSQLVPLFQEIPNEVVVEGHTDTVPMNSAQFPSNWELSGARASSVVRYFIERRGLDPLRFVTMGYGEYRPIATNDTAEGRARNRRVTMVIRAE